MATENQSQATSLNRIDGEIADDQLSSVAGGDKATPAKATSKPTTKTEPYLVVTIENTTITSY